MLWGICIGMALLQCECWVSIDEANVMSDNKMSDNKRMLTLEEAAQFLGVSKTSLRRWTTDGQLSCHRIGVRAERRFDQKVLDEFLLRHSTGLAHATSDASLVDATCQAAQDGRHKHVCLYFRNPIEQWEAFRHYFLNHYRAGLPTTYLHSASSSRAHYGTGAR